MSTNEVRMVSPVMLYQFEAKCRFCLGRWDANAGFPLDDEYRLPVFSALDGQVPFADVRAAWNPQGLYFNVDVSGKQQSIWCRETQLLDSDGFQLWIDTRNTRNIHRANRFCHWFVFLPTGGGAKKEKAVGTMLKINRAKEDPKTLNQVNPKFVSKLSRDGYRLTVHLPAEAMTGWDTDEHLRLGINYLVTDRELGYQSFSVGPEFPIADDPSLWQSMELVR